MSETVAMSRLKYFLAEEKHLAGDPRKVRRDLKRQANRATRRSNKAECLFALADAAPHPETEPDLFDLLDEYDPAFGLFIVVGGDLIFLS